MSGIVELCGNVHPSYRTPGTKWVPVCERKADHPSYHAKGILYWQDEMKHPIGGTVPQDRNPSGDGDLYHEFSNQAQKRRGS